MIAKGYGESSLRNECQDNVKCTETEHQYNRRTEVKITKMDAPISIKFINNAPAYISEAPDNVKYSGRKRRSSSRSSSSSSSSSSSFDAESYDPEGRYKVVAGAFANMSNAEKRLGKIRSLGYNNADILKFGSRGLFHVVVSSYSNSGEASSLVRELKRKDVRAFIKK
jgi:cell division protein FtsN